MPPEKTGPTIYQGDRFQTDLKNPCTIGYIDTVNRIAYTAGHCGMKDFDKKRTIFTMDNKPLGTMFYPKEKLSQIPLPDYSKVKDGVKYPEVPDVAGIKLNDDIIIGGNKYSGDTIVGYENLNIGDEVCYYGSTSQKVKCGTVKEYKSYIRTVFLAIEDRIEGQVQPGDSGGVMWIKNKGFVAVINGITLSSTTKVYGTAF